MPSLLPPICRGSETIMGSTHLLGAFPHMQKHSPGPAFHAYEEIGRQLGARDEQLAANPSTYLLDPRWQPRNIIRTMQRPYANLPCSSCRTTAPQPTLPKAHVTWALAPTHCFAEMQCTVFRFHTVDGLSLQLL